MMPTLMQQIIVFSTLLLVLALFVWGRWRYDLVALLALLIVTLTGIVPGGEAFVGFGHAAVVTVGAVLVVSRGLQNSGLIDMIARWMSGVGDRPTLQVAALTSLVTLCSGLMNNVGALALMMPVAIRLAHKSGNSPSVLLMPLAFASLLGGMTTLIGTPPNIIVATFRAQTSDAPFRMFDFTPVGVGLAAAGIVFIALIGWRLIPQRQGLGAGKELFHIEDYITEVRVREDAPMVGKSLRDLETATEGDVTVVGIIRGDRRLLAPSGFEVMWPDDILIVEADPEELKTLVDVTGLELVGSKDLGEATLDSDEVSLVEVIIMPRAFMEGQTAVSLNLRWRYGLNLLAVARQGARVRERLSRIRFQVGDVLLLQGRTDTLQETLSILGCLPLAERGLRFGQPRRILCVFDAHWPPIEHAGDGTWRLSLQRLLAHGAGARDHYRRRGHTTPPLVLATCPWPSLSAEPWSARPSLYVPTQNRALSPQCGFASTAPGNLLTEHEQRRKPELVV